MTFRIPSERCLATIGRRILVKILGVRERPRAEWEATELVSCSLELQTKMFPRHRVYRDCIVGVLEVEFHHIYNRPCIEESERYGAHLF